MFQNKAILLYTLDQQDAIPPSRIHRLFALNPQFSIHPAKASRMDESYLTPLSLSIGEKPLYLPLVATFRFK